MTILGIMMVRPDDVRDLTPRGLIGIAGTATAVPELPRRFNNPLLTSAGKLMIRVAPYLIVGG